MLVGAEVGVIVVAHLPWLTFPGYDKVSLQGQPRPGAVSRMRSSQMNDTNSGGDTGANSGRRGGSELNSTPTRRLHVLVLGEMTPQERPLPTVTPSSQKSDIKSVGNDGGSSGHRSGDDHCSTLPRADMSSMARRCIIARKAPTSRIAYALPEK